MYIHIPQQQASKNARELSELLVEVVREAKKRKITLNHLDVRQALHLTGHELRGELGGISNKTRRILATAVLLILVATAVAGFVIDSLR